MTQNALVKPIMAIVDAEKIHIIRIRTLKGNIDAPSDFDVSTIGGHKFKFATETGIDESEGVIGFKLTVDIDAYNSNDVAIGVTGSYTHEIIFKVENLSEFVQQEEDNSFTIEGSLASTLLSITYSTVRGIIMTRTQGTSLGSVVLPVIDPAKLM